MAYMMLKWEKNRKQFQKREQSSMSGTLKALFDIRDGNNGENFTGEARVIDSKTCEKLSVLPSQTLRQMTVPESGTLTIYGKRLQLYKL